MLVLAEIRRYAAWLDDARLFCGFGHASDDALARAVTIDANAGEVTTYSDDLGADVVPFFDRVVAGAPHGYAVAVSRPGLALVACNLARDVVVVRRDPDDATGGAWYLARGADILLSCSFKRFTNDRENNLGLGRGGVVVGDGSRRRRGRATTRLFRRRE